VQLRLQMTLSWTQHNDGIVTMDVAINYSNYKSTLAAVRPLPILQQLLMRCVSVFRISEKSMRADFRETFHGS